MMDAALPLDALFPEAAGGVAADEGWQRWRVAPSTSLMVTRGEGADEEWRKERRMSCRISAGELLFHSPSVQVQTPTPFVTLYRPFLPRHNALPLSTTSLRLRLLASA